MSPEVAAAEARQRPRLAVSLSAQLRQAGGVRLDANIHDLSETGFRADCLYGIAVGTRVFLTIPTFTPMEASVAWRAGSQHGCHFLRPLYPAVFDTIVARYQRA